MEQQGIIVGWRGETSSVSNLKKKHDISFFGTPEKSEMLEALKSPNKDHKRREQ